jgi:hypothetical protein
MQHGLGTSSGLVDTANTAPRQFQAWLLLALLMVMVAVVRCLLLPVCACFDFWLSCS